MALDGLPKAEFNFWVGMLAPAGTPRDVLGRLNGEIQKALAAPDTGIGWGFGCHLSDLDVKR